MKNYVLNTKGKKNMKTKSVFILLFIISYFHPGYAQQRTIENLQDAYQEEANAAYQFDLYSEQANKYGLDDLSRLFCALSQGESIHMKNHQIALEKLGKEVKPIKYQEVRVGSNSDNLKEAIKYKARVKRVKYREYAKVAKKENMKQLSASFNNIRKTEINHENLLKIALFGLDKNIPEDYYVSSLTGEVIPKCQCVGACKCETPPAPKQKGEVMIKF
jgi:rubrerythrin